MHLRGSCRRVPSRVDFGTLKYILPARAEELDSIAPDVCGVHACAQDLLNLTRYIICGCACHSLKRSVEDGFQEMSPVGRAGTGPVGLPFQYCR